MILRIRSLERPPPAVWLAAIGLLIGMPLIDALGAVDASWGIGGSPAMALLAPYFAALQLLHAITALLLATLLLTVRNSAAPGIAIVALWLEYPPMILLFSGMYLMAASGGHVSWPVGQGVPISCLGPAFVTLYLLALPGVRRFYGIGRSAVDARDPGA